MGRLVQKEGEKASEQVSRAIAVQRAGRVLDGSGLWRRRLHAVETSRVTKACEVHLVHVLCIRQPSLHTERGWPPFCSGRSYATVQSNNIEAQAAGWRLAKPNRAKIAMDEVVPDEARAGRGQAGAGRGRDGEEDSGRRAGIEDLVGPAKGLWMSPM